MTKNKLLEIAATSKLLKGLCFKLCNKRDISNDLFQEFLLFLCEKNEDFLLEKYNNIKFISYCTNVIVGLNLNRYRDSKAVNTKNPLVERHNSYELIELDVIDEGYSYWVDEKFNKTIEFLKEIENSEQLIKSIESTTREVAELLEKKQRRVIYENNKIKTLCKNYIK